MTYGDAPPVLASAVWPNLFQGGLDSYSLLTSNVDVLALCAGELQFDGKPGQSIWIGGPATEDTSVAYFERLPGTAVLRCPMDDYKWPLGPAGQRQWRMVWNTAGKVAKAVQAGKRVLVTCAEGRNRSGLVNAVALHQLTGWDGEKCIQHIKFRRPRALDNPWFCSKIRELK
jgi:hypothetical protein